MAFMESYADYVENLTSADWQTMKGELAFDDLTGTLTNDTEIITGSLDSGQEQTYDFGSAPIDLQVEWNLCSDNFASDLTIATGLIATHLHDTSSPSCLTGSEGYDDFFSFTASGPFTVQSLSAPFFYSIATDPPGQLLFSDRWTLELSSTLPSGKKVFLERKFP